MTKSDANEGGEAVRSIARSANLLAEAEALLPVVEAALTPATEEEMIVILMEEGIAYDVKAKGLSDPEWGRFWITYLRALEGISAPVLREAFVLWSRNHLKEDGQRAVTFYPRAPQLQALATEVRNRLGMMRHRARAALDYRPPKVKVMDKLTKAEMIERGWMNADGSVNLGEMTKPKAAPRSFQAEQAGKRPPPHVADHAAFAISRAVEAAPLTDGDEAV